MIATKDLYNKVFDYTDTWGETLAYKSWVIRAYYNRTIISTPGQVAFGNLYYLTRRPTKMDLEDLW